MTKITYVTFNDTVSGIYRSQVIDVLEKLNEISKNRVRLIAFFSIRNYWNQRKILKEYYPSGIALPMFPKARNWKWNKYLLKVFVSANDSIVGRGIFATNLALEIKGGRQKVCYDGRGAITEEFQEYNVDPDEKLKSTIKRLESKAVLESDFRLAVSERLVEYWQNVFGYTNTRHVVIPCCVSKKFARQLNPEINRSSLGWSDNDIVMVFSGSVSGWQSFSLLNELLSKYLAKEQKLKVLFLSGENENISLLMKKFNDRVQRRWVNHNDVYSYLKLADYGILIREQSVTNQVASPVKFSEYLSAGLKVLISDNLGDFSELVTEQNLGVILQKDKIIDFHRIEETEKDRIMNFAMDNYYKESKRIQERYQSLIKEISE